MDSGKLLNKKYMKTGKHNKNYKEMWNILNKYLNEGMSNVDAIGKAKKDLDLV